MNHFNFYMDRGTAHEINNEIEFISGKSGLSEERCINIMKIYLLSTILNVLTHPEEVEHEQK